MPCWQTVPATFRCPYPKWGTLCFRLSIPWGQLFFRQTVCERFIMVDISVFFFLFVLLSVFQLLWRPFQLRSQCLKAHNIELFRSDLSCARQTTQWGEVTAPCHRYRHYNICESNQVHAVTEISLIHKNKIDYYHKKLRQCPV